MPASTKLTRALVDTAMGRTPADLVIRNGRWVSVQSGEIIPNTDVAVKDGHIAFVGGDASHTIGKKTQVIDANGRLRAFVFISSRLGVGAAHQELAPLDGDHLLGGASLGDLRRVIFHLSCVFDLVLRHDLGMDAANELHVVRRRRLR